MTRRGSTVGSCTFSLTRRSWIFRNRTLRCRWRRRPRIPRSFSASHISFYQLSGLTNSQSENLRSSMEGTRIWTWSTSWCRNFRILIFRSSMLMGQIWEWLKRRSKSRCRLSVISRFPLPSESIFTTTITECFRFRFPAPQIAVFSRFCKKNWLSIWTVSYHLPWVRRTLRIWRSRSPILRSARSKRAVFISKITLTVVFAARTLLDRSLGRLWKTIFRRCISVCVTTPRPTRKSSQTGGRILPIRSRSSTTTFPR